MDDIIIKTLNNLKRTFLPHYCQTTEEAIAKVLELIPKDAKVGIGGSMTIANMGIPNLLKIEAIKFLWRAMLICPKSKFTSKPLLPMFI